MTELAQTAHTVGRTNEEKRKNCNTAIFANAKGGVGKSTLALMLSLGIATRHPAADVELIDLDNQATSSESLKRFSNHRFRVMNDDNLFLASGSPNNGNIINHIETLATGRNNPKYIVFDSPAGNEPGRSSFLLHCDVIFVPTSVSDADIFATRKYLTSLQQLFLRQRSDYKHKVPLVIILPNLVDSRAEFNELRKALDECPAYIGEPLYYSPLFRRAFRAEDGDKNVRDLLCANDSYIQWLTTTLAGLDDLRPNPPKLFQL